MPNDSPFDPAAFMASNTSDAGSTALDPIPAGDYTATIDDVIPRSVNTKNGPGVVVDISYLLHDAALQEKGRARVRQGIFVDLTPSGGFDMSKGKNVQLNRVRAAVGQNENGKVWNLAMLKGAGPLKVHVKLRPDKNSPDVIYNDVATVGKL